MMCVGEKVWRVTIGVPTIDSADFIYFSMSRLREEILRCPSSFQICWVICLNGANQEETRREILRFVEDHPAQEIVLLENEQAGRNRALNRILRFARDEHQSDLLHCFDDDVELAEGSLRANLQALCAHELTVGTPLLVGSALRGRERSLSSFLEEGLGVCQALWSWFLHRIFLTPYLEHVEIPRFCEGFSFGAFVVHMREYPDDATGVTDDTFLSNFFAVRGRREPGCATFKPEGSVGYMKVPSSFREWERQQLRIHAGIIRSFRFFERDREFLEEHFAWPFSFQPGAQTPLCGHNWTQRFFAWLYRLLHLRNYHNALLWVERDEVPDWGAAMSTKPTPSSRESA